MKNLTITALTIFCLCVIYTSLTTAQYLQNVNEAEQSDIKSKSQELGINEEQLQGILNSTIKNGGGDPLPEAMQEKFFIGQAAGDVFGSVVSSGGDVNGDGYSDIIVGAPNNDAGGNNAGRAYIYFGGNNFNQVVDVILTGIAAVDLFGISVASAGDVNGDGYFDVIVGATGNDAGGTNAGRAYIYYGGPAMDNIADVLLTGAVANDNFGNFVSTAGDVNGDGFSDVIVAAQLNDAGGTNAGRAYIFFGGSSMNNTADIILTGAAAADQFGNSVSTTGDVNGDGYSDVIVGAYLNDAGGTNAGRAYIYFGGASMDNIADLILTGAAGSDNFGISVSSANDVNGDGYSDVIVGAYLNDAGGINAGRAYIYLGGAGMDNIADVILTGTAADDWFGYSVSTAGDMNGDGYSDVIVGAHMNSVIGAAAGRVFVYFGGQSMDSFIDITLNGEASGDQFGYSVSVAGDVNGDGYSDVLVGANLNDAGGSSAGKAYLYLNSLLGPDIPDLFFTGAAANYGLGISVSDAGDLNGDGYPDVIVGASGGTGQAYIYFGGAIMDNTADVILTGEAVADNFGGSVSTAGDVNGDGYGDVIVGAYGNDAGGTFAGRAYIYFGGIAMNNVADVILTGPAAFDLFGRSVSDAGDVNGDGYDDVISGAYNYDVTRGRAFIYFGGVNMDTIPDVTITGLDQQYWFGYSVSNAGDVNMDGYSDVIVGALNYNSSQGRAYIYFGGSTMNNTADVVLTGTAAGDDFGRSVSTAGDVNGDGYPDVIVGANGSDAGVFDGGQAYIYFGGQPMNNIADVILTGVNFGYQLGMSVSAAGDLNMDGYSDVIVGANAGSAFIYFGGRAMNNQADVILTGAALDDNFGYSVSSAGDVNQDGYTDVIVGAWGNDAGGTNAGRAYMYLSSSLPIRPSLKSVKDIPLDQGGFVRVRWNRSGYDIPEQNRIADYILQRSDPPGLTGFVWDYVVTVPAIKASEYSYVAQTPNDSSSISSGTFYFRVIARGTEPEEMWYSNIKYGQSVDNLSPSLPLNFYAGILGNNVKLGWKANTEPDLYNYVIYRTDVAGANPDTLEIYAQTFDTTFIDTNPLSGTAYYFLRAQDVHNNLSISASLTVSALTFALSVAIMDGWNMTSVPGLHPVNQNVNTWWQFRNPLADVYKWTTTYVSISSTSPTEGYWMLHSGARTYNTNDEWPAGGIQFVTHNPITVNAGWNMIGGYENSASVAGLTTTPPGLIVPNTIYGWNGTYYNATNLEPGYGYWILLNGAGVINPPTLAASPKIVVQDEKNNWGKITITDASGKSFILYSANEKSPGGGANITLDHYQLPPLPPAGNFDVRYSSNRKVEDLKEGNQTIEMRGLEYPVTVGVEKADLKIQDETGKYVNAVLKSGEEIKINNTLVNKLLVAENNVPIKFSLEQNYPNPFNPLTIIRYSVADAYYNSGVPVHLVVYDILGSEVVTLVNEVKQPGYYEVEFNAENLSSGIYFYKLQSGSFVETKKMLMIK